MGAPVRRSWRRWLILGTAAAGVVLTVVVARWVTAVPADLAQAIADVAGRYPDVPRRGVAELMAGHGATGQASLVVDVRPAREWRVSLLPGAVQSERAVDIVALIDADPERELVLYCSVGERSSRLARKVLGRRPGAKVFDLEGGLFAWAVAGGPLVTPEGVPTRLVHPYNDAWGRLLPEDRRAIIESVGP